MQSFLVACLRHEIKVHLTMRNCCIHLLGNDVWHYWVQAICNDAIPHIEKLEPYLCEIFGPLYSVLRDRKIVKTNYTIRIPVAGFKYPEIRSFDMLRLDNQLPEESSIVCRGYSLIYLKQGGRKAALDIVSSLSLYSHHLLNL